MSSESWLEATVRATQRAAEQAVIETARHSEQLRVLERDVASLRQYVYRDGDGLSEQLRSLRDRLDRLERALADEAHRSAQRATAITSAHIRGRWQVIGALVASIGALVVALLRG